MKKYRIELTEEQYEKIKPILLKEGIVVEEKKGLPPYNPIYMI